MYYRNMQKGEYIIDRLLPSIIEEICLQKGIELSKLSDDWVLRLEKGDKLGHIIGYKFSLNGSAEAEIAQDKVATYEILSTGGINAVEHRLVRTKASDVFGWESMFDKGSVVAKPLDGTSGHGVRVCHDAEEVKEYVADSGIEAWAISPLLDIDKEIRVILLDGEPLICLKKNHVLIDGLKVFNLSKGATAERVLIDKSIVDLAKSAAVRMNLRLAAVDIVVLDSGETAVLEINDGFMMENYARMSRENLKEVKQVYNRVVARMME